MFKRVRGVAGGPLLGSVLAFGAGCNQPQDDGPTEAGDIDKETQTEVRAICELHCDQAMDTECNPIEPQHKLFRSYDECYDRCTLELRTDEVSPWWTSECGDLHIAQVQCIEALTCDERVSYYSEQGGPCFDKELEASFCHGQLYGDEDGFDNEP